MARLLVSFLLALVALAGPATATWSIILVDTRTGEIAIGCATCLTGFDLVRGVPVLVVGKGAACAQSFVDTTGQNRLLIRDQLRLGTDPAQILALLAQSDPGHQTRQYGIVDTRGRALGFTGTGAGAWAGDRVGRMGDIVYAVQGNVLTGPPVLAAAELALWNTKGDLGEKLMAAMEAARSYGGDGRCSCNSGPTACGSPPASFTKSADVGFMILSRPGDTDGTCTAAVGCANGSYYMLLNVKNQQRSDPDPVLQLKTLFAQWQLSQRGRPDHLKSSVAFATPDLQADGRSKTVATVVLRDREGTRLTTGGARVTAALDPASTAAVTFGAVTDHGDGSYSFPVIAGTQLGKARIAVTVDDGGGPRVLVPLPELPLVARALWASRTELSKGAGGAIDFAMFPGSFLGANRGWVLLMSNSGSRPGIFVPPAVLIPLNPDPLFFASATAAFHFLMPELIGAMPPSGQAWTTVTVPPGAWGLPLGSKITFAYVLWNPLHWASPPLEVELVR